MFELLQISLGLGFAIGLIGAVALFTISFSAVILEFISLMTRGLKKRLLTYIRNKMKDQED